ncbi:MAG: PAS domain S-box protein, partial [Gemmatimonadales bacterium]
MALDLNPAGEPRSPREPERSAAPILSPAAMLRWAYVARLALVFGVLLGALVVWGEAQPEQTFLTTVMFLVALAITGAAAWQTEVVGRRPSRGFLAAHTTFDVLLVTGIVYVTGGADSGFAWLYILAIAQAALFLPLAGAMVVALLAPILYFSVIAVGYQDDVTGGVILQMALFGVVAVLTGILGDRLRKAGMELGEVRSELRRLRLDTGEILASISTGVLTVDADGRLLYLNPAGEALLGLDVRQWEGAPVAEALRGTAPEMALAVTQALSHGRAMHRRRAEIVRDGEQLVLGLSVFVREEPDEPRSITVIFQDITDLEQMEILNRRTERLEAVAELSAALAHEIKNPLASIRSAVEQFASPRLDEGDRASLTRMVVRESDRLSRLLSDFLDFSRVRLDRVERRDLGELVQECAALVRQSPDMTTRGVKLELVLPGTPLEIVADGDLLHRALLNLVLNAVQFTPDGGTVVVAVEDLKAGGAPR